MASIPSYINELVQIVDKLPVKDKFSKVAKADLYFKIGEYLVKKHNTFYNEIIDRAFKTIKGLEQNLTIELIHRHIALLVENEAFEDAFNMAKKHGIDPRYIVDLILEKKGKDTLELLNIIPKEIHDYTIIRVWLVEGQKDNIETAVEEIKKLDDSGDKLIALLELARLLVEKSDNEKAWELVNFVEKRLEKVDKKYKSSLYSLILRLRSLLQDEKALDLYKQWREKIYGFDYIHFMPELYALLIQKNMCEKAHTIVDQITDIERKDMTILGIIDELKKKDLIKEAAKISLKIKDDLIMAQAYLIISKYYKDKRERLAYCKLAFDKLLRWMDAQFTILQKFAERIKEEDKNYANMNISQIIFFHPQASAYLRNIINTFSKGLNDIMDALIELEMFNEAIHLANYACSVRRFGCEVLKKVMFLRELAHENNEEIKKTLSEARGSLFYEMLSLLVNKYSEKKQKLTNILLDLAKKAIKDKNFEKTSDFVQRLIEIDAIDNATEIIKEIEDKRGGLTVLIKALEKLLEKNYREKAEELLPETLQLFEEIPKEEALGVSSELVKLLTKLGNYDKAVDIVKKYAEGKDPWSAGLLINNILTA